MTPGLIESLVVHVPVTL